MEEDLSQATILLVDDAADNLDMLRDLLTFHNYAVLAASSGTDALRLAGESHPDLILLDIIMPGMDGYEVCARLKADDATSDIPVIFVSSLVDVQNTVKGFQVGGADYVVKPFQQAEILARINTHITNLRLREQLKRQNMELEHLASLDFLTGLKNRRHFFKIAEAEFRNAVQNGVPVSVTLFDIDHYKNVNDIYGHQAGDQVLASLAGLINVSVRQTDVAARYGGDEFVVLHPSLDVGGAYQIAEIIRRKVGDRIFVHDDRPIQVTISAGTVDTLHCGSACCFDDVLAEADRALYQAKGAGRNQVVVGSSVE